MSTARLLIYIFWVVPVVLQVGILAAMIHRGLRHTFPFFFHYTVLQVLSNAALYYIAHFGSNEQYFYGYWASDAISAILGFAVIREIFNNAFRPFAALRDFADIIFKWAATVLVVVAFVLAFSAHGGNGSDEVLMTGILGIERGVMLIQGGLLLFLLLFSNRLGITWKNHCFGLALGFGVYSSTTLVLDSLRSQFGAEWHTTYSILQSACYAGAVLVWTAYIFSPEPVRVSVEARFEPKPVLHRWNEALAGSIPARDGAFLTDMEQMVERVLSQDQQSKIAG
jgi:hypothetical protein